MYQPKITNEGQQWVDVTGSAGTIDLSPLQGFDAFAMGTYYFLSYGCCSATWDTGSTCRCCDSENPIFV